MKNQNNGWSTVTGVSAFFLGVILMWSFGKNWLNLESAPVFLAGLMGVAVAVLFFAARKLRQRSTSDPK